MSDVWEKSEAIWKWISAGFPRLSATYSQRQGCGCFQTGMLPPAYMVPSQML